MITAKLKDLVEASRPQGEGKPSALQAFLSIRTKPTCALARLQTLEAIEQKLMHHQRLRNEIIARYAAKQADGTLAPIKPDHPAYVQVSTEIQELGDVVVELPGELIGIETLDAGELSVLELRALSFWIDANVRS
jgi:hypothetical protein